MTPPRQRASAAVAALLAGVAVTACSADDGAPVAARTSSAGASVTPTSGTSDAPVPQSPTAAAASASPARSPAPAAVRFPPASSTVEHGRQFWAVYLAVSRLDASGEPEDPERLAEAERQAAAVGYEDDIGSGDIGCEQGAEEALRLDPARDYRSVSIFFDTQVQAQQFVDAFQPPVVGTARITAYCLD